MSLMSEEPYNQNYVIMGRHFVDTTNIESISITSIPKHIAFFYNDIRIVPNKVFDAWKRMAPGYKIVFFSFKDAAYFLEKCFNQDYKKFFNKTTYAAYKSDFFRVCFLYKYGGIYSDIDNVPLMNIDECYSPYNNVRFMTALSLNNNSLAQALIISTRGNPCVRCGLDEYINIYTRLENSETCSKNYDGNDLGGTRIMYRTIVKLLSDSNNIKNNLVRPHTGYGITDRVDDKPFRNCIVFLDEFTPNGRWQNSHMRNGFNTVLKCRYDDYPWFGHNRNPESGHQTYF